MKARGLYLHKDQLVIPSRCPYLTAYENNLLPGYENNSSHSGIWICACKIQETKPKVCSAGHCIKLRYPGIEKRDLF